MILMRNIQNILGVLGRILGELSSYRLGFYRKLSEKLFSSAASANDVNEARCNPLICEPTVYNFKLMPQDYALVLMTDKVYQMYLKAGR